MDTTDRDGVDRRGFFKRAGLIGAAAAGALPPSQANAEDVDLAGLFGRSRYQWLMGDHHTHSQYSYDAMYTLDDIAAGARNHGGTTAVRHTPLHRRAGLSPPAPCAATPTTPRPANGQSRDRCYWRC